MLNNAELGIEELCIVHENPGKALHLPEIVESRTKELLRPVRHPVNIADNYRFRTHLVNLLSKHIILIIILQLRKGKLNGEELLDVNARIGNALLLKLRFYITLIISRDIHNVWEICRIPDKPKHLCNLISGKAVHIVNKHRDYLPVGLQIAADNRFE